MPNYAYLGSKGMSNDDLVEFLLTEAEKRYGARRGGLFELVSFSRRDVYHETGKRDRDTNAT